MAEIFEGIWLGDGPLHGTNFKWSDSRFEDVDVGITHSNTPSMRVPETPPGPVYRHKVLKRTNHDIARVWVPEGWSDEQAYTALDAR